MLSYSQHEFMLSNTILIETPTHFLLVGAGVKQDTQTFLNCGQLCAEIGLHAAYLGLSKSLIRERAQLVTEEGRLWGWETMPKTNLHKVTVEGALL